MREEVALVDVVVLVVTGLTVITMATMAPSSLSHEHTSLGTGHTVLAVTFSPRPGPGHSNRRRAMRAWNRGWVRRLAKRNEPFTP